MTAVRQWGFSTRSLCVFLAFITMVLGDDTLCGPGEYHDGIGSSRISCKSCAVICNPNRLQQEDCDYFCPDFTLRVVTSSESLVTMVPEEMSSNDGGDGSIIAAICVPLVLAVVSMGIAVFVIRRWRSSKQQETDEEKGEADAPEELKLSVEETGGRGQAQPEEREPLASR